MFGLKRYRVLMLNEWSDRTPPGSRKPLRTSVKFWLSLAATLIGLSILIGLFATFSA